MKIIADTTACFSEDVRSRYDIPLVPQVINFGNESYLERVELDIDGFMRKLSMANELPKTAAPPPELFAELFKKYAPTGETILCIHPSAEVSGTIRSASVAAQDFPEADIRIIDTRTIASTLGTLITLAAEWSAAGMDADTICQRIEALSRRSRIYFMVATLDYLLKGGRIGGASALIGTLLQIKPILAFNDGKVDQYERERTHKRAIARLKQLVEEQIDQTGEGYPTVLHAGVYDEARILAAELSEILSIPEIPVYNIPPAIVTHAGPGVIGVGFFTGA